MPVENLKSTIIPQRHTDAPSPDPIMTAGIVRVATGQVDNAADATAGSAYHLIDLPSACIIDPSSFFVIDTWGFASVRIGTSDANDGLISVARSTGPVARPVADGDANFDKRLWEVLGLAEDPGGFVSLFAYGIAAATAAGSLKFRLVTIHN